MGHPAANGLFLGPAGTREEFNSDLNSTRALLAKRRRDRAVRTPRVQDIVSEAAGYLPGAFRTPTDKGDKMPLKETFNCDHNNRCPPGSRARTKLAGATSPTGTGAIGTDAFLVDRGRFHFILVLLDFRWRFKATVTTRRTCFCVLSTCKNVGKRRGSVRVEYRLRTESYGFGSSSTQTRRRTLRPSKTFSACRLRIHHPCVRVRATPVPRTYRTKEARVRHGLLTKNVADVASQTTYGGL
ncbi:hypothetical protein Bbelb_373830 [Branchiostoma belcheri]|nr:hypothetical protein Bbelb_373830 [Branchiostoma belcheri]